MSDNEPEWPTGDQGAPPAAESGGTPPQTGDAGGTPPPPNQGGSAPPPPPPPPPATGAAGATGTTAGQAADLGPRLGARLIDAVILWIVSLIIVVPLVIGSIFNDVGANAAFGFGNSVGGWIASLVTTAIYVGYFAYLESSRGQTIGKQLLNLRVVGPGGGNPTMEQALKRNLWLAASIIPIVGGLIQLGLIIWIIVTISGGSDKRGVHDQFAGGTQVVRA